MNLYRRHPGIVDSHYRRSTVPTPAPWEPLDHPSLWSIDPSDPDLWEEWKIMAIYPRRIMIGNLDRREVTYAIERITLQRDGHVMHHPSRTLFYTEAGKRALIAFRATKGRAGNDEIISAEPERNPEQR